MAAVGFGHLTKEISRGIVCHGSQNRLVNPAFRSMCNDLGLGPTVTSCAGRGRSWSQTSKLKSVWQRFLLSSRGQRLSVVVHRANEYLNVIALLFARQCNAIAALRIRRTAQITHFYSRLYNKQTIKTVVEKCHNNVNAQRKPISLLLGAVLFAWDQQKFSESEIDGVAQELTAVRRGEVSKEKDQFGAQLGSEWENVINRDHLIAWRKPIPETYLFEYKIYGSFKDIPARAFFNVQIDLEYRKQWDKLIIHLDVVDRDGDSGSEVIRWVMHFPYPMYSREYIFLRKYLIDHEKNLMVFMAHGTEHPQCPVTDKHVRVHHYKSNMVIRPDTTIDENGFDYILTYYDDPQASIPNPAIKWMAAKGVPDFVDKLHRAAKTLHESRGANEDEETATEAHQLPM